MGIFRQKSNDIVQVLTKAISGSYDAPAYWNNTVYYAGPNDEGRSFNLVNGSLVENGKTPNSFPYPGASPVISSDGTQNGIIWMISSSDQLIAYDATNLSNELWSANLPAYSRFTIPAITSDGHVEVGVGNMLVGFGL